MPFSHPTVRYFAIIMQIITHDEKVDSDMQSTTDASPLQRLLKALEPTRRQLAQLPWRKYIRWLSVLTTAIMFIVLLQGSLVTNTGSQAGCGASWPLCKGQFIPQFALSTAIEFAHRVVVAPATLLIILLTIGVLVFWRQRLEIKILAPAMIVFLVAQALLGAAAVLWPESAAALALHLGVSLLSFASVMLTMFFLYEERSGREKLRDRRLSRGFLALVWGLLVYCYIVVYIGAFVRHTGSELACTGWPLCNGQVIPSFNTAVTIVFTHRVAALVLTLGIGGLFIWARSMRKSRPDLYWGSLVALLLVVAQALEGAFVVYSHLDIFSTIGHSALVSLFFGAMCYLALHTLRRPRAVRTSSKRVAKTATKSTADVEKQPGALVAR
ncbi:MAG: COX15/CtaA family protein [Ktedonobacterales bacterium]